MSIRHNLANIGCIAAFVTAVGGCGYLGFRAIHDFSRMPYTDATVEQMVQGGAPMKVRLCGQPIGATYQERLLGCSTAITLRGESGAQYTFWDMRSCNPVVANNVNAEAADGDGELLVVEAENGLDGFLPHRISVNGQQF